MTVEKLKEIIIGSESKQTIYDTKRHTTVNLDFSHTKIATISNRKAIYCYAIALFIDEPEYKECYSEKMGGFVSEFGWWDFYCLNRKEFHCLLCSDYQLTGMTSPKWHYVPVWLQDDKCPSCGYKYDIEKLTQVVENTTWNP